MSLVLIENAARLFVFGKICVYRRQIVQLVTSPSRFSVLSSLTKNID